MKRYRTILMAIDFSKPADRAFAHALGLATACRARVRVVHVVAPYEAAYFEHVGATEMRGVEAKLQEDRSSTAPASAKTAQSPMTSGVFLRVGASPCARPSAAPIS